MKRQYYIASWTIGVYRRAAEGAIALPQEKIVWGETRFSPPPQDFWSLHVIHVQYLQYGPYV